MPGPPTRPGGHPRRSLSVTSISSIISQTPSIKSVKPFLVPLAILIGIVIASAAQTEFAHYISHDIGFNQPYFQFFVTHITFSLIFPVHLLVLRLVRPNVPLKVYFDRILEVVTTQLSSSSSSTTSKSLGRDEDDDDTDDILIKYTNSPPSWTPILKPWSLKICYLTLLISIPALSWFIAILYSPAMDITAIYATSSFSAYFFSMMLLKEPLSRITVGSIGLAFAGVVVLSLAGTGDGSAGDQSSGTGGEAGGESVVGDQGKRFLGDGIMLFGAILLGLYEVIYKMALPEDQGGVTNPGEEADDLGDYEPISNGHIQAQGVLESQISAAEEYEYEYPTPQTSSTQITPGNTPLQFTTPLHSSRGQQPSGSIPHHRSDIGRRSTSTPEVIPLSPTVPHSSLEFLDTRVPYGTASNTPLNRQASSTPLLGSRSNHHVTFQDDPSKPSSNDHGPHHHALHRHINSHRPNGSMSYGSTPLPPALHANFITSCIGLATLLYLWIPIPILHYLGYESFKIPNSIGIWASLVVVAWGGAIYNAGLMILIGIWGPTTSSVANLLTIGLVAVIDAVLTGMLPDGQTMVGVGMICVGFGVLLWEGEG